MSKKTLLLLEDRLKEHRFKRDWTQTQLALAIGLSLHTIQRAEVGEPLSERTQYKLEQFLKREEKAA